MKFYYLNRKDREDRNYLFRGAMAMNEIPPKQLVRCIAKNKEDYPSRAALCDAAIADGFTGFFSYQRDREGQYPGFGHLVCSWGCMRIWRRIADGKELGVQFLDDYCLKQPLHAFGRLIEPLDDLNILQLAWHKRDDIFLRNDYNLPPIPYQFEADRVSEKSPDFLEGTGIGSSDWALVLSPDGAAAVLQYMNQFPYLNSEVALTGLHHTFPHMKGLYSLRHQNRNVNGLTVLRDNPWVRHLIEYSDEPASDLIGVHNK